MDNGPRLSHHWYLNHAAELAGPKSLAQKITVICFLSGSNDKSEV